MTARRIPLQMTSRPRVLVTGGAGFVGSHLCDALIKRGASVICLDNFFTGSHDNIRHLLELPNFELVRGDVIEKQYIPCDEIFHLACPASPVHYKFDPVRTLQTCVTGTNNMLDLAVQMKAKFLFTSTSEIYGDPQIHPQVESYFGNVNPIGVRACYDEGKRAAECLVYSFAREYNLDVRVSRIFNTYGPRMTLNDGRVVTNMIAQALQDKPLTVYGNGMQTRSFQYISDLISGLENLMMSTYTLPVNIGNPNEITILELAHLIQDITKSKAGIIFVENTADDPHKRNPDISVAKNSLDWEPKIPLRDGLALTVADVARQLEQ